VIHPEGLLRLAKTINKAKEKIRKFIKKKWRENAITSGRRCSIALNCRQVRIFFAVPVRKLTTIG
jgi:hypothetical protein